MRVLVEGRRSVWLGADAYLVDGSRELAWAENHITDNPAYRWVLGRYVEAGQANDNGHVFDLDDLRAAQSSLVHAPLNMIHRPHNVVGCYVASELIYPVAGDPAGEAPVAAAAMANPYMEALAAFYRYYFPEELALIESAHRQGSLFFCVDEETELLSAEGWKRRSELTVGEDILTMDTATGLSRWTPLDQVHTYDLDGEEVIEMEGQMHSSVTTPNHRWWVERRANRSREVSDWQWRTSETLTQETWIPRARPHGDFPVIAKHEDALVELAGWFWTEGTDPGSGGVVIYQSHAANPAYCARIEACLVGLFGSPAKVAEGGLWYATDHGRMRHFHLCKAAAASLREVGGRVPTPAFLRSLTRAQLALFIETSIAGDGNVHGQHGQVTIDQTDLAGLRSFEMACALAGIPTNTTQQADGQWHCCLVRRSDRINPIREAQRGKGFRIDRHAYQGQVWCPTTVDGTFLARRRGTVYWTGNSMEAVPASLTCLADQCGQEFAYEGRQSPKYCGHLNQMAARRRLNKPHFVGGALIIPPVSPAWKKADVTELSKLLETHAVEAEMAQNAISQIKPDMGPAAWEAAMHQVMLMAEEDLAEAHLGKDFSDDRRKQLAGQGKAMPDGSFPIENVGDLKNAIKAVGGAKSPGAAKKHIRKRAKALGAESLIPPEWDGSTENDD